MATGRGPREGLTFTKGPLPRAGYWDRHSHNDDLVSSSWPQEEVGVSAPNS